MTTLGVSAALVDGDLVPGDVRLDGDRVAEVGLPPADGGRIAVPGLVDLQVNGFAGVDLMAADVDEMRALAAALPHHGVTAFLPTLITASAADTDRALDRLGAAFAALTVAAALVFVVSFLRRARTVGA
jgi:N-acetylglucosamine-6-phosphate deacetylase